MRQTSDRRRARAHGQLLPELPWLGMRLADETVAPGPIPVPLAPDLTVSARYASSHGLVTSREIAQATGASYDTVRQQWTANPYWPPRRALLSDGRGRPMALYASEEVRQWLTWAASDNRHKVQRVS